MANYSTTKQINGLDAYTLHLTLNEIRFNKSTRMSTIAYDLSLQCYNDFNFIDYYLGYDIKVGGITLATIAAKDHKFSIADYSTKSIVNGSVEIPQGEDLSVVAAIQTTGTESWLPGLMTLEGTFSTTVIRTNGFINVDGTTKRGLFWIKNGGSWKRSIPWIRKNGVWKKGI